MSEPNEFQGLLTKFGDSSRGRGAEAPADEYFEEAGDEEPRAGDKRRRRHRAAPTDDPEDGDGGEAPAGQDGDADGGLDDDQFGPRRTLAEKLQVRQEIIGVSLQRKAGAMGRKRIAWSAEETHELARLHDLLVERNEASELV